MQGHKVMQTVPTLDLRLVHIHTLLISHAVAMAIPPFPLHQHEHAVQLLLLDYIPIFLFPCVNHIK